jgi:hypothetical protein
MCLLHEIEGKEKKTTEKFKDGAERGKTKLIKNGEKEKKTGNTALLFFVSMWKRKREPAPSVPYVPALVLERVTSDSRGIAAHSLVGTERPATPETETETGTETETRVVEPVSSALPQPPRIHKPAPATPAHKHTTLSAEAISGHPLSSYGPSMLVVKIALGYSAWLWATSQGRDVATVLRDNIVVGVCEFDGRVPERCGTFARVPERLKWWFLDASTAVVTVLVERTSLPLSAHFGDAPMRIAAMVRHGRDGRDTVDVCWTRAFTVACIPASATALGGAGTMRRPSTLELLTPGAPSAAQCRDFDGLLKRDDVARALRHDLHANHCTVVEPEPRH